MATTHEIPADVIPADPRMPDRLPEAPGDEALNVPMWEYVIAARLRAAGPGDR